MKYLLVSDIHANYSALDAVLKDAKRYGYDEILSLGDQVNLGPLPKETLDLLNDHHAICLHGNHERYVLSALSHDPQYDAANFESVRFHASVLSAEEITFEKSFRIGNTTFCHAMPDNDSFPVFDPERAIPLLSELPGGTHIICGHGHDRAHLRVGEWIVDCIGSTGCMDSGIPGTAIYTIATITDRGIALQPHAVSYDTDVLPAQYIHSGMAEYAPIMSHVCCLQAMSNQVILVDFVTEARRITAESGASFITPEIWEACDRGFHWPDGITSRAFWKRHRR